MNYFNDHSWLIVIILYVYRVSLHPADGGSGFSCDLHIQTQLVPSNNNDGVLRNHATGHIQMDLRRILKEQEKVSAYNQVW